jgi:hypothetical protein
VFLGYTTGPYGCAGEIYGIRLKPAPGARFALDQARYLSCTVARKSAAGYSRLDTVDSSCATAT